MEAGRGIGHGRLISATAQDGSYVFQLGDVRRPVHNLAVGDYLEVSQAVCLTAGTTYLTFCVRIQPPNEVNVPVGFAWLLTARLNGTIMWSRRVAGGLNPIQLGGVLSTAAAAFAPLTDDLLFRLEVVS